MTNDSSIIDIDSLALETVTGGMPVPPPGGIYGGGSSGQSAPKPPAGGSLTAPGIQLSCPAGSAPDYESTTVTGRAGIGPFGFPVTYHHVKATCEKIK